MTRPDSAGRMIPTRTRHGLAEPGATVALCGQPVLHGSRRGEHAFIPISKRLADPAEYEDFCNRKGNRICLPCLRVLRTLHAAAMQVEEE